MKPFQLRRTMTQVVSSSGISARPHQRVAEIL